jgi:allantoinase
MDERLIRGASVVGANGPTRTDIRVQGGRIAEVGRELALGGAGIVDAGDLLVLPGAIDTHGHQWEPGFTSAPDFLDATASAAVGGVTTLLDHPLTPPVVVDAQGLAAKAALGARTALIDFGLHGGASPARVADLPGLWAAGATGIKVFTCPTGTELDGFDVPGALEGLFEHLGRIGATALVHAEDSATLVARQTAIEATRETVIADFPSWHTLEAEQRAVAAVLDLAARHRVRVVIVHASHPAIIDAVAAARDRGVAAIAETCPHYLHLVAEDMDRLGALAMTAPPVRGPESRDGLRRRLQDQRIDVLGSDHCAVDRSGKSGPRMTDIIPGVPGLDVYLPLLLDLVASGTIGWPALVRATASRPAAVFGLRHKGRVEVGMDADLVVVDPTRRWTVRAASLPGSAGWSPYEGRTITGSVIETWSRGELVAREGSPIGRPGHGRFVARAA